MHFEVLSIISSVFSFHGSSRNLFYVIGITNSEIVGCKNEKKDNFKSGAVSWIKHLPISFELGAYCLQCLRKAF